MNIEDIKIRVPERGTLNDVLQVEREAFGEEDEAILVRNLLSDDSALPSLSLLAWHHQVPVGHILFTRLTFMPEQPLLNAQLLAPLAVVPDYQKKGIGGLLIRKGLKILRQQGVDLVFVLGHVDYYPRHGFIPDAQSFGYSAPYLIEEKNRDAWMVQSLSDKGVKPLMTTVKCARSLDQPAYWRE